MVSDAATITRPFESLALPSLNSLNSLKILELGMHERSAGGGVERVFWGLYDQLAEDPNLDLSAFFFSHRSNDQIGRPGEICLGPTRQPGYRRLWNARRQIFGRLRSAPNSDSGVVATHFALYAAALLPQLSRLNHVVHFHGPWAAETAVEGRHRANVVMKRLMERAAYSSAKSFITLSQAFKDVLVKEYRVDPGRVHVVPGGVDLKQFSPGDQDEARERLGWPKDVPILLCVRRLVRRMGLEVVLDAFAAIAKKHPDSILILGGSGLIRGELETKIESVSLTSRVRLAGFIPESQLALAYRAANLSIVPSQFLEGFGLAAVESLACGTPVLVSPVGGLPETVNLLDPSLIATDKTAPAFADWLDQYLSGRMRLPTAKACWQYAEANFSWPRVAEQVKTVYRQAADWPQDVETRSGHVT